MTRTITYCAWLHLLESQRHHAFDFSASDSLRRQKKRSRACGAVVVDVDDGDARHAQFVKRALTGSRESVDEADDPLLDVGVVDARVFQRPRARLLGHLGIIP